MFSVYPFFDDQAQDVARFLYGTENPEVEYHDGALTLTQFMAREYSKHANALWNQIYAVVRDNCSMDYSGSNPQDDVMERLLTMAFTDFSGIDKEIGEITSEIDVLSGLVQKLVDANATTTLDQTDYRNRYDNYIERYDKAKKRLDTLREQRQMQELKGDILSGFLFELGELYELPMVFKEAT